MTAQAAKASAPRTPGHATAVAVDVSYVPSSGTPALAAATAVAASGSCGPKSLAPGPVSGSRASASGPSAPEFVSPAKDGGWRIQVTARPGSGRDALDGVAEGRLRVRLKAQAQENKANLALLAYLAKLLGVPKSALELAAGHTARHKTIRVQTGYAPDWSGISQTRH